ncbi:hypothetical protein DMN91_012492 [Ooceraea biroi]|uniref:Uncharacterized protein n=1 Tax=Ooceraea biroi TaxID=2015173 RepID=A0A3L8D6N5_OOCBI|nr:hypothetical protein DMN91_012492 [Ooceraea biroi]
MVMMMFRDTRFNQAAAIIADKRLTFEKLYRNAEAISSGRAPSTYPRSRVSTSLRLEKCTSWDHSETGSDVGSAKSRNKSSIILRERAGWPGKRPRKSSRGRKVKRVALRTNGVSYDSPQRYLFVKGGRDARRHYYANRFGVTQREWAVPRLHLTGARQDTI